MAPKAETRGDLAIVGMGVRLPGADTPEQLLEALRAGTDFVGALNPERIHETSLDPNAEYINAGFLDGIERFDPAAFGYTEEQAMLLDPQLRLALEVSLRAFEDAGIAPDAMADRTVAVFTNQVEQHYFRLHDEIGAELVSGSTSNFLPANLARQWNLNGIASCVDTACSSSLLALHLARSDIMCGNSDAALIVGVNLNIDPKKFDGDTQGFVSSDGTSRAFSDRADGMSYGEAAIAVLVKPLDSAIADGDRIQAVVAGSAANHNGARSFSVLAPDSDSITEVVLAAWKNADKSFDSVGYLEAHGSGTKIGDVLEIEAYGLAMEATASKPEAGVHLSTAKSAVGHAMAASGLTSLVRGVLAVREGQRFPVLHAEPRNPLIELSQSGAVLSPEVTDWPVPCDKRAAGVTSCGLSGTNVHVVLTGAPKPHASVATGHTDLITLSGRTPQNLSNKAKALRDSLRASLDVSVTNLAKTLLVGRPHQEERLALRASDRDALLQQLEAYCDAPTGDDPDDASAPIDRVICVVEGEADLSALLSRYRAAVPGFAQFAQECETAVPGTSQSDESLDWFVFRYALLKSLRYVGCVGPDVVALGNGGHVAQAVSGGTEGLRASLGQAATAPAKPIKNPAEAAKKLLGTLKQDERLSFVFLGGRSPLMTELEKSCAAGESLALAQVHAFDGDPTADLLDLIEEVYTAGHVLRADRLEHWLPGSRIAAPGEVFQKARYWPFPAGVPAQSPDTDTQDVRAEIRAIWCDLLGVETLADDADFFESGGGSLDGTKLVRLVEQRFGVKLEFEEIFDFSELADFVDHVIELRETVETPSPQPVPPPVAAAPEPAVVPAPAETPLKKSAATGTEAKLCAIFADVLQHSPIEPESNFFELGGTSLLAAKLFTRVEALSGKVLPLAVLFEAQTPRDLAALLDDGGVERELLGIASKVLGREDVGLDSNFFELGGSSLMAAQLFSHIRNRWGLHYSLSILFEDQTPRDLAARIARDLGQPQQENGDAPATSGTLIKLRSGGDHAPIFLVHNSTGDVYQYLPLVQSLPEGRPIYGVCAEGLSKGSPVPSLEDMIARYAAEIAALDPRPAILVGHSIGGILAREIAQVLSQAGRPPQFLGMIDSGFDWQDHTLSLIPRGMAEVRFFIWLFPLKFSSILRNRGLLPGVEKPPVHYSWVEDTLNHIINRHGIHRYDLKAKLYYAPEGAKKNFKNDYGWDGFVSDIEVEKLSGNHWSILTWDYVGDLAKAISRDLGPIEADE